MGTPVSILTPELAIRELRRRQAARELCRRRLLCPGPGGVGYDGFLVRFPPGPNYVVGRHTLAIAALLEEATRTVEAGGRFYAAVSCPFRHGKTAMIANRFPAWYLGRNPDHEVILATYAATLAEDSSRDARRTVMDPEYERVFGVRVSRESWSVQSWGLDGRRGKLNAVGLTGAVVGKGAHLLVLDDPHGSWQDARSRPARDIVWGTFQADLMTRLAPAHAVVVLMTPLHVDDTLARIRAAMADDPAFPQFRFVSFPARSADYPGGYLFPERYSPEWYEGMYATLRGSKAAAMLDLRPIQEGGQRFQIDKVQVAEAVPEGLKWCRYWDLASSDAERAGSDPSYTVGALVAVQSVQWDGTTVPRMWVRDVQRGQWEAPERDEVIVRTAGMDGPAVEVVLETVAGYKDTATRLEARLRGRRTVSSDAKDVAKSVRADAMEPVVSASNMMLVRAPWNQSVLEEVGAYPDGSHDDIVDALSGALNYLWEDSSKFWVV